MTETKWLEIKQLKEIPAEVWYEYYREMGGNFGFEYFWEKFQVAIVNELTTIGKTPVRRMTFQTSLNRLYNFYNKQHGI